MADAEPTLARPVPAPAPVADPEPGGPEYVNRPDRFVSLGARAWRDGLRDLVAGREILAGLLRRDIASRYRQSLLGLGWAVLTPLAMVLVFYFLHRANLLTSGSPGAPLGLWLYVGVLAWQFFQAALTRTTTALSSQPELVNRVRFPREILVLAALGGALFDFVLGAAVLVPFFAIQGVVPAWTAVLLPLLLLLQVLFSLVLGLILAVLNGALRDLASIVPLAGLLWMFLTPVVYPPATEGFAALLSWLNPMAPIVVAWRDLAFTGTLTMPGQLAVATLLTLALLPVAWRYFQVMLPRVAETI